MDERLSYTDGESPPPHRRRRRVVRIAIGTVVGILVVGGGWYWNALRVARETIDRHRARFERERAALVARPRTRPAVLEPIGTGTAEDVAARFEAAVAALPEEELSRLPPWNYDPSDAAPPNEIDRILAAHPEPLAALAEILHVSSAASLGPIGPAMAAETASIARRQEAVRWTSTALARAIARSDRAAAFRLAAEALLLGADYGRQATYVARLVGAGVERVATQPLEAVLANGAIDVDGARTLARTFDVADAARSSLGDVTEVEGVSMRGAWSLAVFADQNAVVKCGWRHMWSLKILVSDALGALDADMARAYSIVATADGDAPRAIAEAERLSNGEDNLLARMPLVVLPSVVKADTRAVAARRVTRTALAIALRIAQTGSAPASLADLVPDFLARVPTDPWDGKPLHYAAGPPARVWSIGEDAHDDGGVPYAEPDSPSVPGDVVVTIGTPR